MFAGEIYTIKPSKPTYNYLPARRLARARRVTITGGQATIEVDRARWEYLTSQLGRPVTIVAFKACGFWFAAGLDENRNVTDIIKLPPGFFSHRPTVPVPPRP